MHPTGILRVRDIASLFVKIARTIADQSAHFNIKRRGGRIASEGCESTGAMTSTVITIDIMTSAAETGSARLDTPIERLTGALKNMRELNPATGIGTFQTSNRK
jgi:hypothetical protein